MSTKTPLNKMDKAKQVVDDKHDEPVNLIDFMAGIAFLGYAFNRFENLSVPEGSTLGEEVSRESYEWAKAMCAAKKNI
jgi:hypothetical protein